MNSLANPIIPASENIVLKKKPNFMFQQKISWFEQYEVLK